MAKALNCKICGELVEVPDRQASVICVECAEKELAQKEIDEEFRESPPPEKYRELLKEALVDPHFRKSYLHRRAAEKSQRLGKGAGQ